MAKTRHNLDPRYWPLQQVEQAAAQSVVLSGTTIAANLVKLA